MEIVFKSIQPLPELGAKIPDGKTWLGDPCYVVPDSYWDEFCNLMFPDHGHKPAVDDKDGAEVVVEIDGKEYTFWIISTTYGDGCYSLRHNGKDLGGLGVDAGLLSVIPYDVLKLFDEGGDELGISITLKKAILTAHAGSFELRDSTGQFAVVTDGSDEDEEDEDKNEEEDEDYDDSDDFNDEDEDDFDDEEIGDEQ